MPTSKHIREHQDQHDLNDPTLLSMIGKRWSKLSPVVKLLVDKAGSNDFVSPQNEIDELNSIGL